MVAMKRGGQPGNENAVTRGRDTKTEREARRARIAALNAEERRRSAPWNANGPQIDYSAIIESLRALKQR